VRPVPTGQTGTHWRHGPDGCDRLGPAPLQDDTAGATRSRLAEAPEPPLAAALPELQRMTGEWIFRGHPTAGCGRLHCRTHHTI
jgi:hypothetical protein